MRAARLPLSGAGDTATAGAERRRETSPFGERYFREGNYRARRVGRFSMYGVARRYYARLVRRWAPPPRTGRLLELGPGLGHLLALLQDDFRCIGLDVSPWTAAAARRQAPRAGLVVGSADALDTFRDGAFDVIVALHLIEHLRDPAACLRQSRRLLAEGGLLLLATPNPVYALRRLRHQPDAIAVDPTHVNVHPPSVWRAWLASAGFGILRHFGDGLWDVPYLPLVPTSVQFAAFGLPSLVQVACGGTFLPTALGVNQVIVARRQPPAAA